MNISERALQPGRDRMPTALECLDKAPCRETADAARYAAALRAILQEPVGNEGVMRAIAREAFK